MTWMPDPEALLRDVGGDGIRYRADDGHDVALPTNARAGLLAADAWR